MEKGYLIVRVYTDSIGSPVENAKVELNGKKYYTDIYGETIRIELSAPNKEYSLIPQDEIKPFSTYDIRVSKEGLETTIIKNIEIFSDVVSYQDVTMNSDEELKDETNEIIIDDPALWGENTPTLKNNYDLKNTKVLKNVIIPEYIIVHDGTPSNTSAPNYYIPFNDYIKNVACSEIYSTWPVETIKANVHAIVSFTLNRIYTEWYKSKGYNFTITSTTAYDQKYTHGRTIFDPISKVVDSYFSDYINFPNRSEPYFAHYNDGKVTNNPGWLSQWGSKELGDKGYKAVDILRYYYGSTLSLKKSNVEEMYPTSFPGYILEIGACGEEVRKIQNELNKIRGNYPGIPLVSNANGKYETDTKKAVEVFQNVFKLPKTGKVDYATWYKISYIFTAVSKLVQ